MTRPGFALWLMAALIFVVGPATYTTLNPPTTQCPPECSDCGHSWASSKPVCTPKNIGEN